MGTITDLPINLTKARRVTKEEYKPSIPLRDDPVSYCLACWVFSLEGDGTGSLKARGMSFLTGDSDGYGGDVNEREMEKQMEIGQETGAAIASLKPIRREAIHKVKGVRNVFRFHVADLMQEYEAAKIELADTLKRRKATSYLF